MKVKSFLSPISQKIGSLVAHAKLKFLNFQNATGQNPYGYDGCLRCSEVKMKVKNFVDPDFAENWVCCSSCQAQIFVPSTCAWCLDGFKRVSSLPITMSTPNHAR